MRYPSIDILRTAAIFVMVLVHFGENLSGYTPPIAGLGAPIFAFLSGVSYVLWVQGQQRKCRSEGEISKVSVRRGLFVFFLGFAFNVFVWFPDDTFNWDVLTFIGAALLLLNLARHVPLPILVLMAICSVLVSPILRVMADYDAYWVEGYYEGDLTLSDVLIGFLSTGYFPIFPWIAYSLAGFVTATVVFRESSDSLRLSGRAVRVGFVLIATSAVALLVRPYLPEVLSQRVLGGWTMFPSTIEYVCATLGMALALFGLGHRWVDLNPSLERYRGALEVTKTFSQYSLTIYVLHHIVHLWPLWIYSVGQGQEATFYLGKAMSPTMSLPLALVFMTACLVWFRWLGTGERRGIESWMRWLCD